MRELVLMGRVESILAALVCLAIAAVLGRLAHLARQGRLFPDDRAGNDVGGVAVGAFMLVALFGAGAQIHWAVKAWCAPRIYVIEQVAGLVQ